MSSLDGLGQQKYGSNCLVIICSDKTKEETLLLVAWKTKWNKTKNQLQEFQAMIEGVGTLFKPQTSSVSWMLKWKLTQ